MNPGPTGERASTNEFTVGSFIDTILRFELIGLAVFVLLAVGGVVVALVA